MQRNVEQLLQETLGELGYLWDDIDGMKANHEDPIKTRAEGRFDWEENAGHVQFQHDKVVGLVREALERLRSAKKEL